MNQENLDSVIEMQKKYTETRCTFAVEEERLIKEFEKWKAYLKNPKDLLEAKAEDFDLELLEELLLPDTILDDGYPIRLEFSKEGSSWSYKNQSSKLHRISEELYVLENRAEDAENQYTTYFAFGSDEDTAVISLLPVTTPQMSEIKSIVFQSMPMIAAVIFLLVLICSQFFPA